MAPSSTLARIRDSELECVSTSSVVHKRHSSVRIGTYSGAPVALLSFKQGPSREPLWRATIRALESRIAPHPHPNLVHMLGVAEDAATDPLHVVSEHLPTSLYDVLHIEHLSLTRSDVAHIAIDVLHALQFLHAIGDCFGASLTSRKVMLGGSVGRAAKLRRFGLEFVQRDAAAQGSSSDDVLHIPETYSFWKTQYDLVPADGGDDLDKKPPRASFTLHHQQQCDLYAFGVLLLEMCTSKKPDSEMMNRTSCAEQLDPVFGTIVRCALRCGSDSNEQCETRELRQQPSLSRVGVDATASCFLQLLVVNEQQQTTTALRSALSFPSFLHVDRYVDATVQAHVEQALAARESHLVIAVKRLGAVEQELVDEQSNFAVLVQQFETAQRDKQQLADAVRALNDESARLAADRDTALANVVQLTAVGKQQRSIAELLRMSLEDCSSWMRRMHDAKQADMREHQALLLDVLKLKDAKRHIQEEKRDVEAHVVRLTAQIGGENDALEDLEGRWRQVTFKWEQEQLACRKLERLNEHLHTQLTALEDERSVYAIALHCSPTGHLDPRDTAVHVLALKTKELASMRATIGAQQLAEAELQQTVADQQRALERAYEVQAQRDARIAELENHQQVLSDSLDSKRDDTERLTKQLAQATKQIAALTEKIGDFEDELKRQAKKRADEETARRRRQCLTPQCDAPKYLVGCSGYCKECEEKAAKQLTTATATHSKSLHRRQRSLDSALSTGAELLCSNNVKNAPIVELVHAIEAAQQAYKVTEISADADDDSTRRESPSQLLALTKQLATVLKADETLKDDLPECRVLKTLLATMVQFRDSLTLQLECCRCLSVAVFGHDRNRIILVADGAVDIVLSARRQFARDVKLLEATSVLLTNLAHNCESNRKRILDAGGVDAVLEAMQAFPQHTGIQKKSCWALLTLAGSDVMCQAIAAHGGIGAILAGMLNCPADEDVQHYGAWALVNLVSGSTTRLQRFARREGVVEVAEAALACFSDHTGIQEKAREVLALVNHECE